MTTEQMTIMKYRQNKAGEWVRPVMRSYKMMCCDCGLVHRINFRVIRWGKGHKVEFQVYRNNRATANARRAMGYIKLKAKKTQRRYYKMAA